MSRANEVPRGSYPTLFSPFELGGVRVRNRLAHAAIQTKFPENGQAGETLINYHRARAEGGAGLIVTEPLAMTSVNRESFRLRAWDDAALDSLKRLAEAVESADTRLLGQVQDGGRGRHSIGRNDGAVGASALPDDLSWTVPQVLTGGAIRRLIDEWADGCERLQRAGFSGVEVSAGHGHLFHQFLSAWSNRRDDDWGGSLENRARFLTELLAAIRSRCGRPFIVGLKLPASDGIAGSIDLNEAERIAALLAATGEVDYWTFAHGAHANSLWHHLPDAHGERHPWLADIRRLRGAGVDIPTGALGYLTDPHECEAALADGTADFVFLGRPLITDPAFGNKAAAGEEASIRYCVSGNSCWRAIIEGGRLACDNNPRVGLADEADWRPQKARRKRRVVIVGAGIAGLEAAHTAARRGHEVIVLAQAAEPGGKTRLHAALPGGENLSSIYDYQYLQGKASGVQFEFGVATDLAAIQAARPDVVWLATGSSPARPAFLPDELADAVPDLRRFAASLLGRSGREEGRLVILDCDHTEMTYAVAELAADRFETVTIVTPRERIASDVSLINRQGIYHRLYRRGVGLVTSAEIHDLGRIADGIVETVNVWNGERAALNDVVALSYATARTPNDALLAPLLDAGIDASCIGDCRAPSGVMAATRDGYRTAMAFE